MEVFTCENLIFSYPGRQLPALQGLSFTITRGEFVTICGKSGCGKSTLLRNMKTMLSPFGRREGKIFFEGRLLETVDMRTQAAKIGYVLQSPDNQIVTDKVWHELAFGLESLGLSTPEIRLRVAEMASFFGIQTWFHKDVSELSGGQKQLLNLAAIMAMHPSVLILDEPTSQLDPIAATDFLNTVGKINRELGTTVIMTEHRLEEALPLSHRLLVMENGRIAADGSPKAVGEKLRSGNHEMFLAMPTPMRIYAAVPNPMEWECPLTVREGREWLDEIAASRKLKPVSGEPVPAGKKPAAVELKEVWFRYEKSAPDIIKGLSLSIEEGEWFAIVGGNGTGKTTALSLISGLYKPYRGKVKIGGENFNGKLAALPQNPQALFVENTVEKDLYEALSGCKMAKAEQEERVGKIAGLCQIKPLLKFHPYDLSGGEQQRVALAKVLLTEPSILLLDEPTKGLDAYFKLVFADILKKLQEQGVTIVMVSHDVEFCASYARRCAMFFDGGVAAVANTRDFFTGNSFYTTSANRLARHLLPMALSAEDVITACGGTPVQYNFDHNREGNKSISDLQNPKGNEKNLPPQGVERSKLNQRTMLSLGVILALIPLTILLGIYYLDDRKYFIVSTLVILETIIPFAMAFEGRKPQARELVIVAVLCSIAVAGRAAFFMLPQFKPVAAMVIIAGLAFGGETGFLVGAAAGFASNFFAGQGPWSPWQMFAFGIIGFLAGLLFQKGFLKRNIAALCIFGGLATFFIYGFLMNTSSLLTAQNTITWEMILVACLRGASFDFIHSAATVIFLALIAGPMLEKLDRIKVKYGMVSSLPLKFDS